ncbi:MAG: non-homologous end-joining DNA ligase [Chloroflexota bacterium]
MPLDRYHRKRDFAKTPEPAGDRDGAARASWGGGRFVVQRHRATRLHYDFRLEVDGLLASWAVPKGPTLDPGVRRMAVHVEDHPIEYFDFEGVIPKGQYGAGDVIVWDWGTYEPEAETPDPAKAIADGELKFELHGEKLRGRYTLVRTSRRPGTQPTTPFEDDQEQWLLIKKRDAAASAGWDAENLPQSVKTGRTNDEVKDRREALWMSDRPAAAAEIDLAGAVAEPLPRFVPPMLATLAANAFDDPDWLFEIKWDGYRLQAVVDGDRVQTYTRRGLDGSTYFPGLLSKPTWIAASTAVVDGEVVALEDDGTPDFNRLQEAISGFRGGNGRSPRPSPEAAASARSHLVYQAFDLLYLDGRSLLRVPLEDRKRLLRSVLLESPRVRYAAHVEGDGRAFHEAARQRDLEGIVAKLRRSIYEPGRRSNAWLKIKIRPEQELVVGGWTPGEGNAKDLGALAVGVYEGDKLRFAGKVGSGFNGRMRTELRRRLADLETDRAPFDPAPERRGELRLVTWVRPELVIRAEIGGWTREGIVRQTAFKGIDEGHDPMAVTRERPVAAEKAAAEAEEAMANETTAAKRGKRPAKGGDGRASSTRPAGGSGTSAASPAKGPASRTKASASAAKAAVSPATASSPAYPGATEAELEALAELPKDALWTVAGRELKLTNLDKPLFPPADGSSDGPVTKRELIAYFGRIAPAILPHLEDRPLNLHRYPNGVGGPGFWQKDIPSTAPDWLPRWTETGVDERKANAHLLAKSAAELCWLANQASFEIHAWTGRLPRVDRPTFALVDIDPGEKTTWDETLQIARLYRAAFEHLGLRAYPKLTGKRGIQAWLPVVPKYEFHETSDWVEGLSRAIGAMVPDLISWEWAVAARKGRARLDYTQNTYIKTLVAPYAVRPAAGAPVSAPIRWEELDDPSLRPNSFTVRNVIERVAEVGDLFAAVQTDEQELPKLG